MTALKPYRAQLVVGVAEADLAEAGQIFTGLLEEAKRRGLHIEGWAYGEMPLDAPVLGDALVKEIAASLQPPQSRREEAELDGRTTGGQRRVGDPVSSRRQGQKFLDALGPREEAAVDSPWAGAASPGGQGCEHCSCIYNGAGCCHCEQGPVSKVAA